MAVELARKQFTVEDYYHMAEVGILREGDRTELIEGEIVEMSPIGSHHAGSVLRLSTRFNRQVSADAFVNVQNPLRLDEYSEPEPDIALLRPREDY